jgi:hypothetical protein
MLDRPRGAGMTDRFERLTGRFSDLAPRTEARVIAGALSFA